MLGNLQNIFIKNYLNILMIFGIDKMNHFDPYNVFLAIATNVLLMTEVGSHIFLATFFINCKKLTCLTLYRCLCLLD